MMSRGHTMPMLRSAVAVTAALVFMVAAGIAAAQTDAIKRTVLQRLDVAGENKEMVMAIVDIPAKTDSPRQTHPGEEFVYVLSGDVTVNIDGQPARSLKTGDSFTVPRSVKHNTTTRQGVKLLVTWTVDKGAPWPPTWTRLDLCVRLRSR